MSLRRELSWAVTLACASIGIALSEGACLVMDSSSSSSTGTIEPACDGDPPQCICLGYSAPAECDGGSWVCPPGFANPETTGTFDPSACSGASSSSSTSTSSGGGPCDGPADGVCDVHAPESCACSDCAPTAYCVIGQCVTDGDCTIADACTCPDCAADPWCSDPASCFEDGSCDEFSEGCVCADCAGSPSCGGTGGAGGTAGAGGSGGSAGAGGAGGTGGQG